MRDHQTDRIDDWALPLARLITVLLLSPLTAPAGYAQQPNPVEVVLKDAAGREAGTARLSEAKSGVRFEVNVSGLTPGKHGVHIHSTGVCEPPGFQSAGPHYSPDNRSHGFLDPEGPHAGDMPMIEAGENGRSRGYDFTISRVALDSNSLEDRDGSALVIHARPDDYLTDTGGGTGERVVCGVISAAPVTSAEDGAAGPGRMPFNRADKDDDGNLNRGEAAAAGLALLMQDWEQADADANGVLGQAEYVDYMAKQPADTVEPPAPADKTQTIGKGRFKSPETALWDDKTDTYLVSNVHGGLTALDDNGFISRVLPDGTIMDLKWIDGASRDVTLHGPKGMLFDGDQLVVADVHTLRFFDRMTGEPVREVPAPGSYMLNDPALAPDGTLYVTDTGDDVGEHPGAVYRIDGQGAVAIAKGTDYDRPDGLIAHDDALLVAPFGAHAKEVYRLEKDGTRKPHAAMPQPKLDGLLALQDGSLIVTSWTGKEIYRLGSGGTVETIAREIPSPAQVGYDKKRGRLLVPVLQENELQVYKLKIKK